MANNLWQAPAASGPVHGTVRVPGSKSITNRALVIAALSTHPSSIRNALFARDTRLMVGNLQTLGISISGMEILNIDPGPLHGGQVDCGLAGTVMRFLPAVAAQASGPVEFIGDQRAYERPMGVLIDALRELGVSIDDQGRGALPFQIEGTGSVRGGEIVIDSSSSSQFVSGLLLSGTRFERGLQVTHRGSAIPSLPHIEMTVQMLRDAGASIEADTADPTNATWQVQPGELDLGTFVIEPDLSNAAAFLAAAMVAGGSVTIPDWPFTTTQAGDHIRHIFEQMGAQWELTAAGLTLTSSGFVSGIDIDLSAVGELTPTIAAVAALASSPSHLHGIEHLRGHETDRLTAIAQELTKIGVRVDEEDDGLRIHPSTVLAPAVIETYHDHRMATFAAILGLMIPGIEVVNIETTSKTMPNFDQMWLQLITGES